MEEQREERELVGDCREPMEEKAKKGLALSSKTETLDCEDAKTVEVLVDSAVTDGNTNGVGLVTEDGNTDRSASDEKQVKVDVASLEKTVCSDNVEVKPVHEIEGSEICDDVQRVSKIVNVVEVEMNDEMAKCSEVKSQNGEIAGEEDNVTSAGENKVTDEKAKRPLPTDVINEIFSRLPAKSVGKFRSLSKQWGSMLSRVDFIEMHLSRSCVRPRLLFGVERKGVWRFFSSPQPSSSSRVVAADFHTSFSEDISRFTCSYASGLFYFRDLWNPSVGQLYVVCNPITGQYVTLPDVDMYRHSRGFLGFDPVEKKFKVLAEANPFRGVRHEVLTLGTGEVSWRTKSTDCPPYSQSLCEGICINGVLYYLVLNTSDLPVSVVCFDVRSETFKLVVAECFSDPKTTKLVNYKGKLGGIECNYGEAGGRYTLELRLCVLEDVEWSTYVYTLPENELSDDPSTVSVAGMTATGEIVLAMDYTCKPYYVFYFNIEKNTLQSVEIQGFGAELEAQEYRGRVSAFVDHVERVDVEDFKHSRAKHTCTSCKGCIQDLNVVEPKQLGSSIFANQGKRFCSKCEEEKRWVKSKAMEAMSFVLSIYAVYDV